MNLFKKIIINNNSIFNACLIISQKIITLIPKKKNLLLFTSWFGERYTDNTKYLYEYLLDKPELGLDICWSTVNKEIYNKLIKEGKPVVLRHSIKGMIKQIRARMLFSTVQYQDFNIFLLSNCTLIDLGHGYAFKDPGESFTSDKSIKRERLILKAIDYYSLYVSTSIMKINPYENNSILMKKLYCDFVRNDIYYDKKLREGKNIIVEKLKEPHKRAIVYMPTHRSDGEKPMNLSTIMDFDTIQNICEKNNSVFIIKKHYYHKNEFENLDNYPNIFDITNISDIDSQVLLFQTDILISDYSAAFIEYLLLDRPIILYHYDIDSFILEERSFIFSFDEINIAPMPRTQIELSAAIEDAITSKVDKYTDNRNKFRKLYFDNPVQGHGREMATNIICKLLMQ